MSSFSWSCLVCYLYGFLNIGKSIFNNSYNTIWKCLKQEIVLCWRLRWMSHVNVWKLNFITCVASHWKGILAKARTGLRSCVALQTTEWATATWSSGLEETGVCPATPRSGWASAAPPAAAPWGRPGGTPARRAPLSTAVSIAPEKRKGTKRRLKTSCCFLLVLGVGQQHGVKAWPCTLSVMMLEPTQSVRYERNGKCFLFTVFHDTIKRKNNG